MYVLANVDLINIHDSVSHISDGQEIVAVSKSINDLKELVKTEFTGCKVTWEEHSWGDKSKYFGIVEGDEEAKDGYFIIVPTKVI